MGGCGSGRQAYVYDYTVENCLAIDISVLIKRKWMIPGRRTSGTIGWTTRKGKEAGSIGFETRMDLYPAYIRLHYTWNKTERLDYKVFLTKTHPNYGGLRYWFVCPSCDKRVRKLYNPPSSKYFFCRICHNLTYTSCRESHKFDAINALIAARLGLPTEDVKKAFKRMCREGI